MKKKTLVLSLVPILVALILVVIFAYYMSKGTPPLNIANTIITCTQTVCTSQATSSSCTQLNVAVTGCLTRTNVAVCLAGVPSLIGVGYADVVCIVATLEKTPSKALIEWAGSKSLNKSGEDFEARDDSAIQNNATKWLKEQRINVLR